MDSPCRRPERAVVADAAVVLLHAVVVVRSIVRNLDTSVLMNCGCLSHHFQPRLLCSLRRWPCAHHPLLFAHKPTTSTATQNSTALICEDCFFGTDIALFKLEVASRLQMVKGSSFTACTYSSVLTFHGKECNLNPKLKLLILISHSMPFPLYPVIP